MHVQVHTHGYTLGAGEVPEEDSAAGACASTSARTRTDALTRVHFK